MRPGLLAAALSVGMSALPALAHAEQPPPPCHPNPFAAQDETTVANRGDIRFLPTGLKSQLVRIAGRPHTYLPIQAYAEADSPSQLFQYYLLDTHGFQPNVFTARIPGVNDTAMLTATGGNCGLPTIGTVRVVVEPKPGLPTDPNDPRAFIDMFTDMFDALDAGREPTETFYDGYVVNAVIDACFASARSKQWEPVQIEGWRGAATPRIARARREHDGRTVIKEEQMPDGRRKLILRDETSGTFDDVVVGAESS